MDAIKEIMKVESTLPEDWNGTFYFTNWTEEEFVGRYNSKDYHFAPMTTAPMIMPDFSPIQIQQIRKKFAKDLAEKELGNTAMYKRFLKQEKNDDGSPRLSSMQKAATYSTDDLASLIQKGLTALPKSKAKITESNLPKVEDKLSKNEDGKINTRAVKNGVGFDELAKTFEA
jgi:hypothetical protein